MAANAATRPAEIDESADSAETKGTISMSMLECSICLALLCEPVTTPCGHSFCRPCLVSTLRKNKKKCPSCRAICQIEPETHSETIALSSVVKAVFPDAYEVRLAEVQKEKAGWQTVLPIFFYNDTLFPFSPLALYLFEPRYKVMLHRIVQTSRKFAYLPKFGSYQQNGDSDQCADVQASVGDMGVIAEITEIEFLADGRAHLQAKCRDRFAITETWIEDGTQGLHWCKVELVGDTPCEEPDHPSVLSQLVEESCQLFAAVIERSSNLRGEIESQYGSRPADPERLSFWLSSILPVPYENKHALLTCRSTVDRLRVCIQIMQASLYVGQMQPSQAQSHGFAAANHPCEGLSGILLHLHVKSTHNHNRNRSIFAYHKGRAGNPRHLRHPKHLPPTRFKGLSDPFGTFPPTRFKGLSDPFGTFHKILPAAVPNHQQTWPLRKQYTT